MPIIYLPNDKYPLSEDSSYSFFDVRNDKYSVVEIKKECSFDSEIDSIEFKYAADTVMFLRINGKTVINSNVKPDGDFIGGDKKTTKFYLGNKKVDYSNDSVKELSIVAFVSTGVIKLYDFSSGQGGFYFDGTIKLKNGEVIKEESDESWLIRKLNSYKRPERIMPSTDHSYEYDGSVDADEWVNAEIKEYDWNLVDSEIDSTIEKELEFDNTLLIPARSKRQITVDFPLIYASYLEIESESDGYMVGTIETYEDKNPGNMFKFLLKGNERVRFFDMSSIGKIKVSVENRSKSESTFKVRVYRSFYPYKNMGYIETNNPKLDDLFFKCKFAAINCSQTMILDSPKHLEPLGSCSGDYRIITLLTSFMTGDYSLMRHTIRGYGDTLLMNNGENANLSYALVWVNWLYQYYMITGDKETIKYSSRAIISVCELFKTFLDEEFRIDHPYSYVFMDWLMVDGYSLFNPPKALGQTVMMMYYYRALWCASFIFGELKDEENFKKYQYLSLKLKKSINRYLFDEKVGLYKEGETTPDNPNYKAKYLNKPIPENPTTPYFMKHSNFLALAFSLQDDYTSKFIMEKIFKELKEKEIQPYFLHYGFEAVHNQGMDRKYAMRILKEWLKNVKEKDKGLPEGFCKPTPDYVFDHSHAWACSPYYSFLIASSGLKILEPGMKKISLQPKDLGVEGLKYSLATPYGFIKFDFTMENPVVECPTEIKIV